MPRLTPEEYIANRGSCCPNCGSRNIEDDEIHVEDDMELIQGMACLDCNAMWVDVYKLTGYTELDIGKNKEE